MTQADRIRQFAFDHYVAAAKAEGRRLLTIRAGDVHREMGLSNTMPAVCSAIGSGKFERMAQVTPINRTGPANGANVYFQFSLTDDPLPGPPSLRPAQPVPPPQLAATDIGFANSIALVACTKSKLQRAAPARFLYTSTWFRKVRDIIETSGARWFVLSALYGLVAPETEIAPYELTLNALGVADRRLWARNVLDKLGPEIRGERRVVMLAGARYREFLIEPLERLGIEVVVPMEHLRQGEQLGWLSEHE